MRKTTKRKKDKKKTINTHEKQNKANTKGQNKNWHRTARGEKWLSEAETTEHKNCTLRICAVQCTTYKGEACARVWRAGGGAHCIQWLYIIIWLYITLWMYQQLEAIGQMHYMYDGRTRGTTREGTKARQANARAKQTKRPSPTGTSAKTLGDRCGRSHPPPWEEKCAMSKLKETNLNFFCFLIYHFFLYFTTILHDGLKKITPDEDIPPKPICEERLKKICTQERSSAWRGCCKKIVAEKRYSAWSGRFVSIYIV